MTAPEAGLDGPAEQATAAREAAHAPDQFSQSARHQELDLPPLPETGSAGEESRDPLWYKRAVFYEVLVRGFKDSNGDGTGDLRGLTEKLDYLQWLGVDCLWLLPIYKSPLRDGGYDISDF